MDRATLAAYDSGAAGYANDWHGQPAPGDMYAQLKAHFRHGVTADIGCGSGRDTAWLVANGFPTIGYDASDGLLAEARRRYPALDFRPAALPALDGVAAGAFDNVLCETVIMHLPRPDIEAAVRRLAGLLRPRGTLYLSWRVTRDSDRRDDRNRLYAAFDAALVRQAMSGMTLLLDEEIVSASSGKAVHRIVARR